jgi:hypothetical protein
MCNANKLAGIDSKETSPTNLPNIGESQKNITHCASKKPNTGPTIFDRGLKVQIKPATAK